MRNRDSSSSRNLIFALTLLVTGLTTGCAVGPGGGFTLFPTGDPLLEQADLLRRFAPWPAPLPRELQKTVLADYILEPGDGLLIEPEFFDSPLRFPGDQAIQADGTIDLGRFGRLVVAGMTVQDVETQVQSVVAAEVADAGPINVRLVDAQSKVYYVLGEVNAPGAYPLIGRETVLDAIVAAGGLSDRAEPCDVILNRPTGPHDCRVVLPICYRQIVQLGDTSTNYQIRPGDRIFVGTRSWQAALLPGTARKNCPLCTGTQCPCGDAGAALFGPDVVYTPPLVAESDETAAPPPASISPDVIYAPPLTDGEEKSP